MTGCNHIIGHVERDSYDSGGYLKEIFDDAWGLGDWSPSWINIDERFDFCPRCGIRFDWPKLEEEHERLTRERERKEAKRDAAEEMAEKRAEEKRLFGQRMRGADFETW